MLIYFNGHVAFVDHRSADESICDRKLGMYTDVICQNTQGIAKLMEKVRGGRVKFDPNRVVMSGGGTGAQETLAFCLADPGDAFLVPTPYYPA